MADETVIHKNAQPLKVSLQKTSGGYNWEIHCSGITVAEILPVIREVNNKLKSEYGACKK